MCPHSSVVVSLRGSLLVAFFSVGLLLENLRTSLAYQLEPDAIKQLVKCTLLAQSFAIQHSEFTAVRSGLCRSFSVSAAVHGCLLVTVKSL